MTDTLPEFESPKWQIERAREHIQQLDTEINAFFASKPCARVVEHDPNTGDQIYKVRLTAKLPGRLRVILKDATSNLRDALDHAVYAAAVSLGVADPEKTGFPFANDALHLQGELGTWKFSHVPQSIHPILMSFKPYPGGNDLLVGLNRIRNPNTHRVIVPVGFATQSLAITGGAGLLTGGQIGYSRWHPATNEVEYMRLGAGSDFKHDVQITFDVAFGDVEFVRGKPVCPTLHEIMTEVNCIILGLEAETARIKRAAA
jgi:hypothetical protein